MPTKIVVFYFFSSRSSFVIFFRLFLGSSVTCFEHPVVAITDSTPGLPSVPSQEKSNQSTRLFSNFEFAQNRNDFVLKMPITANHSSLLFYLLIIICQPPLHQQ